MSFLVDVKKWDAKLQITSLQSLPSKTSAQSYALTAEQSKTEDGGVELEFVLSAKPNSNSINIPFSKENLTLFYQPPLTEEFKQEDCEIWMPTHIKAKNGEECWRPERVVGSYAVYHSSKKDNAYKTGKICHIFRPKLIDADGKEAWAEFNRDANETGVLTITLPQAFLDSAKYPIVVDPTFGYTSIGGTENGLDPNDIKGSIFDAPANGTLTQISIALKGTGTVNLKGAVWLHSDLSLKDYTNAQSQGLTGTLTFYTYNLTQSFGISSGATYLLGLFVQNLLTTAYDSGDANQGHYGTASYPNLPNPFVVSSHLARKYSIYATYTSGATVQTVADSLSLAESVLRNKTLILSDSLGLTEALYGNKSLLLSDSASLSELVTVIIGQVMKYVTDSVSSADFVSTPSRVLRALEAIGATDNVTVNKVLQITETISLAEIVEVGVGGVKKTRLFLILGDLTVQLTGD